MNSSDTNEKKAHIIKRGDGWAIKKQGASRAIKIYKSIEGAIKGAKKLKLTGHDIIIHKKDGSILRWDRAAS